MTRSTKAENDYRALFIRAQDLFDEMYASLADRASRKLIRRLARIDVLLVGELAYLNLRPEKTNIFFKAHGGTLPPQSYRHHHQSRL